MIVTNMKRKSLVVLLLLAQIIGVFAQKSTKIEGTLLNNTFSKVDLMNAYTGNSNKYASANIINDKYQSFNLPRF